MLTYEVVIMHPKNHERIKVLAQEALDAKLYTMNGCLRKEFTDICKVSSLKDSFHRCFSVVRFKGKIVGALLITSDDYLTDNLYNLNIFIKRGSRRKGIASTLLRMSLLVTDIRRDRIYNGGGDLIGKLFFQQNGIVVKRQRGIVSKESEAFTQNILLSE